MSKVYIRLLVVASLLIALTGATFSIWGLSQLFAGAPTAIIFMAAALEFSKLVASGFLYRYWGHLHRPIRYYLSFAVVTLVVITSVGIFGFLSSAYQASSIGLKAQRLKIQALVSENDAVLGQIAEMRKFIDEIPNSRISKKFEFRRTYEPEIKRLQEQSREIMARVESEKTLMLKTHVEIGPAIYLAESLGVDIDVVVKWLIFFFVAVFDPLAICLVLCLNIAIRLREKYRGNEERIGSYAFTSPVDHRFSKREISKGERKRAA